MIVRLRTIISHKAKLGVKRLATMNVDLSGVDLTMCKSRIQVWFTEYETSYDIQVDFRSEIGVIQFTALVDGKEVRNTTVNFE